MTKYKPKAGKGRKRPQSRGYPDAKASESRRLIKARLLSLEGRISVIESFLSDAQKE